MVLLWQEQLDSTVSRDPLQSLIPCDPVSLSKGSHYLEFSSFRLYYGSISCHAVIGSYGSNHTKAFPFNCKVKTKPVSPTEYCLRNRIQINQSPSKLDGNSYVLGYLF